MKENLSHVFRAKDMSTGKSYVLKEVDRRTQDADNFIKIGPNPNFYPANAIIFGPTRKNVHKCIIITISALTNKLWNALSV